MASAVARCYGHGMAVITDNMRGALMMMGSMAAFTVNDACMKALSDELPLFQAMFLRGVATSVLLYVLARQMGKLDLHQSRRDWGLIIVRTMAEVGSAFFFVTALYHMPLANVTAVLQALPLTVTLAGALFLGEAVGWRRLGAIMVGFLGVLLIVRPGTEGFNAYSIYALLAVVLVTIRDIAARRLSRKVPTMTVALTAALAITVSAGPASILIDWAPLSPLAGLQLSMASFFVVFGYIFSVSAMRIGEVAIVSPFRYTSLLWALILGFLIFGDWPSIMTLTGAAIIVASGVYAFARERKIAAR